MFDPIVSCPAQRGGAGKHDGHAQLRSGWRVLARVALAAVLLARTAYTQELGTQKPLSSPVSSSGVYRSQPADSLPPRVLAARRFLAERGVAPGHRALPRALAFRSRTASTLRQRLSPQTSGSSPGSPTWTPLGPAAVSTSSFGLVTGRVTSIAFDPSDTTGNHLYIGTTGGGVWSSGNAATSTLSNIVFNPLTDSVAALGGARDASISIGALSVQPGGTGVILAGTGDPNDVLDSYYGAGILRSTDGGNTWSLIAQSSDVEYGSGTTDFTFAGEAFAGFAWCNPQGSANPQCTPQTVVAAVSSSYEDEVIAANVPAENCQGLYYSQDGGATWRLATIEDSSGAVVQSATLPLIGQNGNAATAVVWNPVRNVFIAAVRFHGYYTSPDGVTWTRLADQDQPGGGINSILCPTNSGFPGDEGCPIYRGALAVNSSNGDTFAWTVDIDDQDQGLWQDQCVPSSGECTNAAIAFGTQWNTSSAAEGMDASTTLGAATVVDGTYTLALAAVPSAESATGSLVLAGADDLWEATAPYSVGGSWRNTTNAATCMSAQVGEYQHALAWNTGDPEEIFIGNDSGLWRSMDGIAETGAACSASSIATDASHFQNLNGSLGSLAEVTGLSAAPANPYELLAGLGVNGAAGIDETASTFSSDWPQLLTGFGGQVAIDSSQTSHWYVNDQPGVAIDLCAQGAGCSPSVFGANTVVDEADVDNDGETMPVPATFLVDPIDDTQLLVATCRIWRGPAGGGGWTAANAISPVLAFLASSTPASSCDGNALVRSIAAMNLGNGEEIVYAGMYGANDFEANGSNLPGHILSGIYQPGTGAWTWTDLTQNPVTNNSSSFNQDSMDVSSIAIDPHDPTGNTVYATVEGLPNLTDVAISVAYRSTNGGASWTAIDSNLPLAPASSIAIDPQSANTVYIATDVGVYYTTEIGNCAASNSNCWSPFGTGLPAAPAVALSTPSASSPNQVLIAATYGRGVWQAPLWTAGMAMAAASVTPADVAFPSTQPVGSPSQPMQVQLTNTGSVGGQPLTVASIAMAGADPGDFSETDNCQTAAIAAGGNCTIDVTFTPQAANEERTAVMTIYANVYGGQLTVDLTGTGVPSTATVCVFTSVAAGSGCPTSAALNFDQVLGQETEVGTVSQPVSITLQNQGSTPVAISANQITIANPPFQIASGVPVCGTGTLAANSDCQIQLEFAPTQAGLVSGLLTLTDASGTQTVSLSGTGAAPPTDILNPTSLSFPATAIGQSSSLSFTITNNGDLALTNLSLSLTNNPGNEFQISDPCGTQVAAQHPGTCTVTVVFTPSQVGVATGTVTISDTAVKQDTQSLVLSAQGVAAPVFALSAASLTFTSQQPGPQTLTITNQGSTPLANVGFNVPACSSASGPGYCIVSTTCGAQLSAGASCTAQIAPNVAGTYPAAILIVSSSTPGVEPVSIPIDGLVVNPAQLAFAQLAVGQSSAAQSVTITNVTGSALASLSVGITGAFDIAQNGCTSSLAAGANCVVAVVFAPTASGPASGELTISSSSPAVSAAVSLTGTGGTGSGNGFSFTVAFQGASSVTVTAGQTANYTLVITPSGGSGTFSATCGTLPSGALCLFNPATQTLNSGVQGNLVTEISTSASQARLDPPVTGGSAPNPWRALRLACGLLLLPFALRRRRGILQFALLLAVLVCGVSSCTSSGGGTGGGGGGTGGQGGSSSTPPGTYTIPVTVSANGVSQSVEVVLTVD